MPTCPRRKPSDRSKRKPNLVSKGLKGLYMVIPCYSARISDQVSWNSLGASCPNNKMSLALSRNFSIIASSFFCKVFLRCGLPLESEGPPPWCDRSAITFCSCWRWVTFWGYSPISILCTGSNIIIMPHRSSQYILEYLSTCLQTSTNYQR